MTTNQNNTNQNVATAILEGRKKLEALELQRMELIEAQIKILEARATEIKTASKNGLAEIRQQRKNLGIKPTPRAKKVKA